MGRCSAAAAVCTSALLLASAGAFGPDSHELWSDASPDAASAAAGGAPSPPPCMELSNAFGDHMVLQREPERAVVYGTVPALPPRPPAVSSASSTFHSKPISYGAFVTICMGANFYKRRALKRPFRRFLAPAGLREARGRQDCQRRHRRRRAGRRRDQIHG